jgi:hypothetical protein
MAVAKGALGLLPYVPVGPNPALQPYANFDSGGYYFTEKTSKLQRKDLL